MIDPVDEAMSIAATMNRYETCLNCGRAVARGLACYCTIAGDFPITPSPVPNLDPMPRPDIEPLNVPVPQSKEHAEAMLAVAKAYLEGYGG